MEAKSNWASLFGFIDYFERQEKKHSDNETSSHQILATSPRFDNEVSNFIDTFYSMDIADLNYLETLKEHDLKTSHESFNSHISKADLPLLKAMLTSYIRQERFCDGLVTAAIKCGNMAGILKRMKSLVEGK